MTTALWAFLLALAVLWPGKLAGPLDGIPLDQPVEVVCIALLVLAVSFDRGVLRRGGIRALVAVLLTWKAFTAVAATQDGLCVRFISPQALYRDDVRVPHSWDMRADWQSAVPRCSAVMTRDYPELERFPAWFFNLPPADPGRAAALPERPPNVTIQLQLSGYLRADAAGELRVIAGEDIAIRGRLDDRDVSAGELVEGVALEPGLHEVKLDATLTRSHWSLALVWNDDTFWNSGLAVMAPPGSIDSWLRPWGGWVSATLFIALLVLCIWHLVQRIASPRWTLAIAAGAAASFVIASLAPESLLRFAPLLLLGYAVAPPPRRLQTTSCAALLVGLPWLMLWLPRATAQAGLFTWYSPGDDWWMFQRYAYRIYLQGYWLQGGEPTFWFQPLYRWIAGGLHMIFGDSSAGELLWDASAALVGAIFAFHVVRSFATFRWAIVGSAVVLGTYTFGPPWHLFGRGLSEFSSAGFLYAAALLTLRARGGHWPAALGAGLLAMLATFARLNNLPMAIALVVFAWPLGLPAGVAFRSSAWLSRFSRPAAAGLLSAMAIGLWLFTARTYYYTGVLSMLHGTSANLNSVWSGGGGAQAAIGRVLSSLATLVTMSDPPRWDPRALPIVAGVASAILALCGVRRLRDLPLNVAAFCLAGTAGAFVAHAAAYPGRFSIHLIPASVALAICALSLLTSRGTTSTRRAEASTPS